ncbi:MAG: helix-turn-helix domain-containing protein [Thermoflexales bacterium]|nr:helix-turn-helix domain-containing protein [Thermoflexales bacterium]
MSEPTHRRPVIGLLIDMLSPPDSRATWLGASDAAREHGANLLCFVGGALCSTHGFEAQANALYDLIDPAPSRDGVQVNGLIISSNGLGRYGQDVQAFCKSYLPLPVVSVTAGLPLTTVYDQGRQAVELLLADLAGGRMPQHVTVPAEPPARRSCGGLLPAETQAAADGESCLRRDPPAQSERRTQTLYEIGQALITSFDVEELANLLARELPRLDIPACYLALYEPDDASPHEIGTAGEASGPGQWARLVLAYEDAEHTPARQAEIESRGQRFPSRQLIPGGLQPLDADRPKPASLVVEPLYFGWEQIGFVLFEMGPRQGSLYDALRGLLSSALKNISLLDCTRPALDSSASHTLSLEQIRHIWRCAEQQRRVVDNLIDLSQVEADAPLGNGGLELRPELVDLQPLLQEVLRSAVDAAPAGRNVRWRLDVPVRLPMIQADPARLRQVLLNLLDNAARFTTSGEIVLGALVAPPHLHIWVSDTGCGIPAERQARLFEHDAVAEDESQGPGGLGLGLLLARRLVALHCGSIAVESQVGRGSTFHVYLPLPSLDGHVAAGTEAADVRFLLLLAPVAGQPPAEIASLCQSLGVDLRWLLPGDAPELVLAGGQPAALAWDLAGASIGDWAMVQRLRRHPRLCQAPFILYGQGSEPTLTAGLTSFIPTAAGSKTLLEFIDAVRPKGEVRPILIVDDDPDARQLYQIIIGRGLPGYPVCAASGGEEALAFTAAQVPGLVLLDLMMPGMDGFEVLDRLRAEARTRQVPVLILSGKLLSLRDVERIERHARVTFHTKGVLSNAEIIASLHQALFGADTLPPHTSALVKRAVAYLQQNYACPLSRQQVAEAVDTSEGYLGKIFGRELGLSPIEYLNRYRVKQAQDLLRRTDEAVGKIARQVGFEDTRYFSRVFRQVTGFSPRTYRERFEQDDAQTATC